MFIKYQSQTSESFKTLNKQKLSTFVSLFSHSFLSNTMGSRGIFQLYNASTNTYTYYYIHCDSLLVLKDIRARLKRCGSIKSLLKVIATLIAEGTLREHQLDDPGTEPYGAKKCWPMLENSLIMEYELSGNMEQWTIHPIMQCLETELKLAAHQRAKSFTGSNEVKPKQEKEIKPHRPRGRPRLTEEEKAARAAAKATKPTRPRGRPRKPDTGEEKPKNVRKVSFSKKKPEILGPKPKRGRPRLTEEEKAARAAARALLKLKEGPGPMAPRSELAPWTEDQDEIKSGKIKSGNRAPPTCKPTKISLELSNFLGKPKGSEMARTEVTRDINKYIRSHDLQDKNNRRKINPDSALRELFKLKKTDELTYFNLQRYMSPHFAKATSKSSA